MAKDSAPSIGCPGCGSTSFTADSNRLPVCEYCQVAYGAHGVECDRCGTAYKLTTRRCPTCGAALVCECPVCGTLNPLMAIKCLVCQQTLDAVDQMFARLTRSTTAQLHRTRELGADIKDLEEAASEARLAKMWAEEEERRAELAQARAERQRQERLMITIAIGVVAIIVITAIVAAIVLGGGAATFLL